MLCDRRGCRPESPHGVLQAGPDESIELLEPTSPESTIAKFIENKGIGIHHMALACENIEEQLADAAAKGIRLIDATPRKGAEGMTIAFLHPKSTQGILTELCENKNK